MLASIQYTTHSSEDMIEIPDLGKHGPIIHTPKVRDCTSLGFDDSLKIIQLVLRLIRRNNATTIVSISRMCL